MDPSEFQKGIAVSFARYRIESSSWKVLLILNDLRLKEFSKLQNKNPDMLFHIPVTYEMRILNVLESGLVEVR